MSHKKKTRVESAASMPTLEYGHIAGIDLSPWIDRAKEMVTERPALTVGIALGTGFVLGLSVVSRFGRVALVGAMGIAAELVQQKLQAVRNTPRSVVQPFTPQATA